MSEPTSSSMVTVSVTIPFVKESAMARRGLVWWHWKGIWILLGVISIFPVARLTTHHVKSIIYAMSLDVIREATITAAELDGVEVH